MHHGLPQREGVRSDRLAVETQRLHNRRVSAATSLTDLARDYALATPVLLFSHGGWQRDPVADYRQLQSDLDAFWLELSVPLFDLSDAAPSPAGHNWREWEHRLLLCPLEQWPGLARYFDELGGVDWAQRHVHRVRLQTLLVVDVLALARRPERPPGLVAITALTLDGNFGQVHFSTARPGGLRSVAILPATAEALVYGQAVLSEHPKPFATIEPTPAEAFSQLLAQKEKTYGSSSVDASSL